MFVVTVDLNDIIGWCIFVLFLVLVVALSLANAIINR